jgi:hypothetical protein
VVGVILDVVVEVEVDAEEEAVGQIHWPFAGASLYVWRPRVYVCEVCLCPRIACLWL